MATSLVRYHPIDFEKVDKGRKKRKNLVNSSTDASLRNSAPKHCTVPMLSTALGLFNMLNKEHTILKLHALNNFNIFMEHYWQEILPKITCIQALYEDEHFEHRNLAALVASKVLFHIGELSEALTYALGANSLFDVADDSIYVQTLVAKCVDEYISINLRLEKGEEGLTLDPRLVAIVDRVLDQCMLDGRSEQAIGIALECRRLDKLEEAITNDSNLKNKLTYCLKLSQTFVNCSQFRRAVLCLLVDNYKKLHKPDYLSLCQCLMLLDEPLQVARILNHLVHEGSTMVAYQVAFDLFENENQAFLTRVKQSLEGSLALETQEGGSNFNKVSTQACNPTDEGLLLQLDDFASHQASTSMNEMEHTSEGKCSTSGRKQISCFERLNHLKGILSGDIPINLHLHFLRNNSRFDLTILKSIKQSLEIQNSICHSATIYTNALIYAGTTMDTFLKENLEWLQSTTNWAKFSAIASLGVIYKGQLQEGVSLLSSYILQHRGSPWVEGGALYAMGLIYTNHGQNVRNNLISSLQNANHEVIEHGACLGIGLAGLGTSDEELYEEVKHILYKDSAAAGEAAGIAMGLLYAGSGTDKAHEMLLYAQDTIHEKITRGLALGIALTVYGKENEADPLIERMTRDKNPVLRYGGMFGWAMAYRGTANTTAIRRLLHHAVFDVSDDVKRTAVIALGFVLCTQPEQTPRIVSLLVESHNAYVRYGAALAIGISCAGTASKHAIALLETLVTDTIDFVRQGGLIGMAMVLLQHSEPSELFQRQIDNIIKDLYEKPMTKMGAILAHGILDAAGRNVSILLKSRNGHCRRTATVGMAVFCQFWYWYPLIYFISLSFYPTAFIGLNEELQIPKFTFISQARPSMFAYPSTTVTSIRAPSKIVAPNATLSKGAKRACVSNNLKYGNVVIMQEASTSYIPMSHSLSQSKYSHKTYQTPYLHNCSERQHGITKESLQNTNLIRREKVSDAKLTHTKFQDEPSRDILWNPSRIVPAQVKFIHFPDDNRFVPLLPERSPYGFVILKDKIPSENVEYVWDVNVYTQSTLQTLFGSPKTQVERIDANPFLHP